MTMWFAYALFAAGTVALLGMVCRLGQLDRNTHKLGSIALHAAAAVGLLLALKSLLDGHLKVAPAAFIVGVSIWVAVSWTEWRQGVPRQFFRRHVRTIPTKGSW